MSEDPALLANQQAQADLAAKVAYQQALIQGQTEDMALKAAIASAANTLQSLGAITSLQGPRNAFQQQAMEVGLNRAGYSNAIDALAGRYNLPAFGRQYALPQAQSIGTIAGDLAANPGNVGAQDPISQVMSQLFAQLGWGSTPQQNTGYSGYGNTGAAPAAPGPTAPAPATTAASTYGGGGLVPTVAQQAALNAGQLPGPKTDTASYMPTMAQQSQQLAALPNLGQIDVRQWGQMSPDTQNFILGAYSTAGQSPTDVQNAIKQNAPQFSAPRFGSFVGG